MEAVKDQVLLMEIEKELAGPNGKDALAKYDAVLVRLGERIDSALKEGLPPEEFPKVGELKEASVLARKILRLTARVGG